MKFWEIKGGFLQGRKIRCTGWIKNSYIQYKNDGIWLSAESEDGDEYLFTLHELQEAEWEYYESLTFREALDVLLEGGKVMQTRREGHQKYIRYDHILSCLVDDRGVSVLLTGSDVCSNDWYVVEE